MAKAAYMALLIRNITLRGLIKADLNESYFDEVLSYVFAGIGFFWQFKAGFKVPFPLTLLLWPFDVIEYWLRWSITTKSSGFNGV